MKILWLSHLIPYPPKGGVLQRSYNLLRETAKRHDVHLVAFVQRDLLRRAFVDVDSGLDESHKALTAFCRDVRFVDIPSEKALWGKHMLALRSLFSRSPYTINWLRSDEMEQAIQTETSRHCFDVVHFDTISLAPYLSLLKTENSLLDHHNIESHMMRRRAEQENNWPRKLYFMQEAVKLLRYEKAMCDCFDVNITCSSLDSNRLAVISPRSRIEEIPNGVDDGYFTPRTGREVPGRLIFAGGLNWYPNRDAMLYFAREIWPELKRRYPQVSMDVIGANPPPELLAIARSDSAFKVHGYVDDVRPYLWQAAVYVCPIRDGGGTKLKILDAFAMAKATVAHPTACEGIDVIPGQNVLLAADPQDYVSKIGFLLSSPAEAEMLGANARRLVVDKYLYSSIGEKLSCVYRGINRKYPEPPIGLAVVPTSVGETAIAPLQSR